MYQQNLSEQVSVCRPDNRVGADPPVPAERLLRSSPLQDAAASQAVTFRPEVLGRAVLPVHAVGEGQRCGRPRTRFHSG